MKLMDFYEDITILPWYLKKYFTEKELQVIATTRCEVTNETPKFIQARWVTSKKYITKSLPKNVVVEYMDAAHRAKYEAQKAQKKKVVNNTASQQTVQYGRPGSISERYEMLLHFAKENKVKNVRRGMKAETLLRKIAEAGLALPNGLY